MISYKIDKSLDTPLYIQIRTVIERAISNNELTPGDKLPAVSQLAKEIGVTQATVRRALQDLSEAGHTTCHVGRGTFIQDANCPEDDPEELPTTNKEREQSTERNSLEFATKKLRLGVSKALCDIMALAAKPGIIHLSKGVPDPSLLPAHFLEDLASQTFKEGSSPLLEATDPLGNYDLRQRIAERYSSPTSQIDPAQVLITNGTMQGLTLIAQANLENKYRILCETPGFKGITDTFTAMGHWVETIPRDSEGPGPYLPERDQNKQPYLLYLCPYAHNPTGKNLSRNRYTLLVDWAKKNGSLIVADEIFRETCFSEAVPPSLIDELGPAQTVVVSSLSKSIMTGLRLGWLISSRERIQQLAGLKRLMDHCAPTLIQGMAHTIFASGILDSHSQQMQTIYKGRCQTMMTALKRYMPKEVSWSKPEGSFSLMLQLPSGYSSIALFLSAIEKGVSFLPGPLFDIDHRFVNCLRLSYAWSDTEQIIEGIELLASAIEELLRTPPGNPGLGGLGSYQ